MDTLTTIVTDSGRVVLSKVIPNNGILKLSPFTSTSIETENANVLDFQLFQNYPNPFNPSTKIKYNIPNVISTEGRNLNVILKVFDVLGNDVATLVDEEKSAGNYEVDFTVGRNSSSTTASGIYFYQLKAGSYISTKKMLLLK